MRALMWATKVTKQRTGHLHVNTTKKRSLCGKNCLWSDVKPEMNLLTLSTHVHDKGIVVRFLQNDGVIHQHRLRSNGHLMALSAVLTGRDIMSGLVGKKKIDGSELEKALQRIISREHDSSVCGLT